MRIATRKQDWKIVNISELDGLEKYLTLFLFVFHIWHWFYLSQLVERCPIYKAEFQAALPETGAYQLNRASIETNTASLISLFLLEKLHHP